MVLLKLPFEKDLELDGLESGPFLEAFNNCSVSSFIAKVDKRDGGCIDLDGWILSPADWFLVVED